MAYGQITHVYAFGGAAIWDPVAGRRYGVQPDAVRDAGLERLSVVSFEVADDGRWVRTVQAVRPSDLPDEVARRLNGLGSGAAERATG
jgi:hypothetical protein